ncbi:unnamed protein product [Schistosoma turkestanicum]|nr:unnamed protein product [Schistosoma turkestanicum]
MMSRAQVLSNYIHKLPDHQEPDCKRSDSDSSDQVDHNKVDVKISKDSFAQQKAIEKAEQLNHNKEKSEEEEKEEEDEEDEEDSQDDGEEDEYDDSKGEENTSTVNSKKVKTREEKYGNEYGFTLLKSNSLRNI